MKFYILPFFIISSAINSTAITINVDYTYDTNNYFDAGSSTGLERRAELEAAAARWSRVITDGNLEAAEINDTNDGRIGFIHPGTGDSYQISGATSSASDNIAFVNIADEYRSLTFAEDELTLFAGGRSLSSAAAAGSGSGTNFTTTFTDPNSHINRGFNGSTPINGYLPTWGGSISFSTNQTINTSNGNFYSLALHEIGHILGLSTDWINYTNHVSNGTFTGSNAIDAFNSDNSALVSSLGLASGSDFHFEDNGPADGTPDANQSIIFDLGDPEYDGTVGEGNLQDLILEPTLDFTNTINRFELTNVDIGALQDVGWTVIPEPSSTTLLGLGSLTLIIRRKRQTKT